MVKKILRERARSCRIPTFPSCTVLGLRLVHSIEFRILPIPFLSHGTINFSLIVIRNLFLVKMLSFYGNIILPIKQTTKISLTKN